MIQSAKFTGKWFTIVLPELGRVREKGLVGLGWAWARLCVYVSIPPPKTLTHECKKATFSPRCNNHAPLGLSPVIFCLLSKELSLRRVMSRLTIFNADENSWWTIQCVSYVFLHQRVTVVLEPETQRGLLIYLFLPHHSLNEGMGWIKASSPAGCREKTLTTEEKVVTRKSLLYSVAIFLVLAGVAWQC